MNVLLEKGDSIIVTSPGYQSLGEVARAAGARVKEWPLDPDIGNDNGNGLGLGLCMGPATCETCDLRPVT